MQKMSTGDALSIAIPALALLVTLWLPGEPRWLGKPWFVNGAPRRAPFAAFFAILLIVAIARSLS